MSESTLTIKKVIPIIGVAWILSLVTTLAFVYFAPNIIPRTWHEVAKFSGTFQELERETTDSFRISSDQWRIYWSVECKEPPPEDVEFRLFVLGSSKRDGFVLRRLTLTDFRGSIGHGVEWLTAEWGTEYITGSGEFSLWLVGARLDWEIIVEAYY